MRVLVACEYSGRVREAFRKIGHDAWSCDLLPSDDNSPYHYQCDVLEVLDKGWDLMIAHPPCTYLANAGLHYSKKDPERMKKTNQALEFLRMLYGSDIPMIAVENPVGYTNTAWRKPDQIVNPFNFGTPERKQTCLWLKGLPKLEHTNNVPVAPRGGVVRKSGKKAGQMYNYYWRQGKNAHERSKTFQCIADAMAQQWGAAKDIKGDS